jgi:hypothetical protein
LGIREVEEGPFEGGVRRYERDESDSQAIMEALQKIKLGFGGGTWSIRIARKQGLFVNAAGREVRFIGMSNPKYVGFLN